MTRTRAAAARAGFLPGLVFTRAGAAAEGRAAEREAAEATRQALATAVRAASGLDDESRDLIAELLWFHQRSQKPQWWALFDRQTWSDDELSEDLESLGGLSLDPGKPGTEGLRCP